jgi:mutator protein MutT
MNKERFKAWGSEKIINIACCLVFDDTGRTLLLRRHPENLGGGRWGFPGGRVEPGETAKEAALRELEEETGLKANKARSLGEHQINMPHGTVHNSSFEVTVKGDEKVKLNPDEHTSYRWFYPQELVSLKDVLWGIPTVFKDFNYLDDLDHDITLNDGSSVKLL